MSEPDRILPVIATERFESRLSTSKGRKRVVITGAAGVVGTVAARALCGHFDLVGIDINPAPEPSLYSEWHQTSVDNRAEICRILKSSLFVLHAATGAAAGWAGLQKVEIDGTRNILDAAASSGVSRVVITSTNHVVGWTELDFVHGVEYRQVQTSDLLRPDGLYAASKIFMEALARAASEYWGLRVSVLRLGTMRLIDDPILLANDTQYAYLGGLKEVINRMNRSWLYHPDFIQILLEEFDASDDFRIRFATSNPGAYLWSDETFCWSRA